MTEQYGQLRGPMSACRQFGSAELAIYRFLLAGQADEDACREATGLDADAVSQAIGNLSRSKLIQECRGEPGTWVATSSDLAFLGFISRLRSEYSLLSERTTALNTTLDELQGALMSGSLVGGSEMVPIERIPADQAGRTLAELLNGAQQAIRVMHPVMVSESAPWWDVVRDSKVWERGLDVRSIYPHTIRRKRGALRFLERLREAGAEFRTTASVMSPVVLVDDRTAMLLRACGDGGILAREPNIVEYFSTVFEETWQEAVPVTDYDYDQDVWREIELLVLGELSAGRSDGAIARRLDISTRTLRRYVTGLYERFGVETRFQLGVVAAQAGILPSESDHSDEVMPSAE